MLYLLYQFELKTLSIINFVSFCSDLLKHDKVLSKKPPAPHLRVVPDYLLDATTKEASKRVKLARAAMGNNNPGRRQGFKKKIKKDKDPLKSLSTQVYF